VPPAPLPEVVSPALTASPQSRAARAAARLALKSKGAAPRTRAPVPQAKAPGTPAVPLAKSPVTRAEADSQPPLAPPDRDDPPASDS
jgi:hypothetical protein